MKEVIFNNYQCVRLDIQNPNSVNCLIISIFLLLTLLSLRKCNDESGILLEVGQTEQLKGMAIFFVVLGHLWVHVSKTKPTIVLSSEAVAIFLMLSGFGLALSNRNKKYKFIKFFAKRVRRIFPSYLITTYIIILLDYVILDRHLGIKNLFLTTIGINLTPELYFLDYVRWFVTFILLWYLIFYCCNLWFHGRSFIYSLVTIAVGLLFFNYYYMHFSWYQFLAFPTGCAIGVYYNQIKFLWKAKRIFFNATGIIGIAYIILINTLQSDDASSYSLFNIIPTIVLVLWEEINSLVFCISAICIFAWIGEYKYKSRVLILIGKYSYQVFLIHGTVLIKYDPVIKSTLALSTVSEFVIFFGIVVALSSMLYKIQRGYPIG